MAAAGSTVIINGRDKAALGKATEHLREKGYNAYGYAFDVCKKEKIEEYAWIIIKDHGLPDIVVNNASIQARAPLEDFAVKNGNRLSV